MSLHCIQTTQRLPITLDHAWGYFSDPNNLPYLTPPWLGMAPSSNPPREMFPGLIITYDITPFPLVRTEWVTEITHVEHHVRFVDEQRRGPYAFWHHRHDFREIPGGTEIADTVHYALPFGPIGDLINCLDVASRLQRVFAHRRAVLTRQFGTPSP